MVLIGAGYTLTQKLVEVAIEAYFDAAQQELLLQADPANIDNSRVFRRVHEGTDGNDSTEGGSGQDRISLGDGDDTLAGLSGEDLLQGGRGKDQLFGGADSDEFYFTASRNSRDVVKDFELGLDRLVFQGLSLSDLSVATAGGGTVISWSGGSVRLNGIATSSIDAASFDFV